MTHTRDLTTSMSREEKKRAQARRHHQGDAFDLDPDDATTVTDHHPSPLARSTDIRSLVPGTVLLKSFLTPAEQQRLVDDCRELGRGEGGFYRPQYTSGAKVKLRMMCLGRHWNVQTETYEPRRSNFDHARVPALPPAFLTLVQEALDVGLAVDASILGTCASLEPDICIANFYTHAGRNGLHQDKDESPELMKAGSPIVSFSVGCTADFAYAREYPRSREDQVPVVALESGDVLIFGGPSRMLVHALTRVYPGTAPTWLRMRKGRLNLTFRQYGF